MACANPPPEDLTCCSICKEIITDPRALPCLHTFCLECLKEWSKSSRESLICPIVTCKKTTQMPSDGVDGLPGNVFVSSLIERSPARSKKVPCVCCEEIDNEVVAKCFDCNGFLCQEGVDMHKKPLLKMHQMVNLAEIKSGQVDVKTLASKKKPTCSKHEGQPLWFFCKTCEVLICRDCTVVNHQKPDHLYVELESIASEQRGKLQALVEENKKIQEQVGKGIEETSEAHSALAAHVKSMLEEIDLAIEKIKSHIDSVCQSEKKRLIAEQSQMESIMSSTISSAHESLKTKQERLQTALNMANQVLQMGSDYDMASMYKRITEVLEKYGRVESASYVKKVESMPRFRADSMIHSFNRVGCFHEPSTSWILEGDFGGKDVQVTSSKGLGKLSSVRGIASTHSGDIAVACNVSGYPVKVYSLSGNYKFSLDEKSCNAWEVASCISGKFYVTSDDNKWVTVFGSDGRYQSQFAAKSPAGTSSHAETTALKGLAINAAKGQICVGEINKKYISIHRLNGEHLKSLSVEVKPVFIATTQEGNIVVSPNTEGEGVQVIAPDGMRLHTINAPEGVSTWHPAGVCCNSFNDIHIFNRGAPAGIYRFSSTGKYIICINKDTKYDYMYGGMTFSHNGEKLLVADGGKTVKIFRKE